MPLLDVFYGAIIAVICIERIEGKLNLPVFCLLQFAFAMLYIFLSPTVTLSM